MILLKIEKKTHCGEEKKMWSTSQRHNKKRGTYAIVHGRGYPRVTKGRNSTNQITAPSQDREQLWRDPAVVLSDADLDECDGAQGLNLCYEHNQADVVGKVSCTYINDKEGDTLDLIARIPIKDEHGNDIVRGLEMVEQIRAGRIKGFSVGYDADVRQGGVVHGKQFNEISLVEEPFFGGCNITVGVMASATGSAQDSGN
jgi:hypothetical protein